jgi:hypothetical protein
MARVVFSRRAFVKSLSAVLFVPADRLLAAPLGAVGERRTEGQQKASSDVALVEAKAIRRLPDLPGQLQSCCFSPDGRQFVVACKDQNLGGAALHVVDVESDHAWRRLSHLSDATKVYSIAWEPSGTRIALSAWEHRDNDPKPYQTCLYLVDSGSGKILSRKVLWEERNPLAGVGLRMAWIDKDRFLAVRGGSPQIFEIDLPNPALVPVSRLNGAKAEHGTRWVSRSPITLGEGRVGFELSRFVFVDVPFTTDAAKQQRRLELFTAGPAFWETRRLVFARGGRQISTDDLPTLSIRLHVSGVHTLLLANDVYLRSYSPLSDGKGEPAWLRELVKDGGNEVIARVPERSPFLATGFDQTLRSDLALSSNGRRLAMWEMDFAKKERGSPATMNHQERFGRLVTVDFPALLP